MLFFTIMSPIIIWSQFTNIMISDSNSPNEPAIAIDINNTDRLIAASNINNYYISNDAGVTWEENELTSSIGVWGDPVLLVDDEGSYYFFHLSNPPAPGHWIDRIICQKTTDNGETWNDGSFFGLNGEKDQDKEWAIFDNETRNIYVFWTEFDSYGSANPAHKTRIMFVKSTDQGATWSIPIKVNSIDGNCVDVDDTVEGAVPAIGPAGEIYTSWSGPSGIRFQKSTNQGDSWLSETVLVDTQPGGWDFGVSDIYRANGFPITLCDLSGGSHHGTIYINWSDQRNGENDTDIWLKKSTDGGSTWGELIRVNNDDSGHQQFFTWMTIDQTTGYLYAVFYDRRDHDSSLTDVYLARSTDGGETFTNHKISETPFLPNSSVFFGDYNNITAHNGVIRPIWTRLHEGDLSVWTAIINEDMFIGITDENIDVNLEQNFPNPAKDETYVSFKLRNKSTVNLTIYDSKTKIVAKVIENETLAFGKHVINISLKQYNLKKGVYFYTLQTQSNSTTKKMIIK